MLKTMYQVFQHQIFISTISQVFQHQIVLEEENYAQCQQYCKYDKIAQYSIYHVIPKP